VTDSRAWGCFSITVDKNLLSQTGKTEINECVMNLSLHIGSQCSVVNSYHFHRLAVLMMVRPTRQSTDSINFLQIVSFPPIIYHFEHGDFCFLVRDIPVGAWWLECSFYMHIRISRKPSPVQTVIDHKQLENVEYFNCLRSTITNDAKCTREIKPRIAMPKSAFKSK
jgi:hypothetical protein